MIMTLNRWCFISWYQRCSPLDDARLGAVHVDSMQYERTNERPLPIFHERETRALGEPAYGHITKRSCFARPLSLSRAGTGVSCLCACVCVCVCCCVREADSIGNRLVGSKTYDGMRMALVHAL